MKKIAVFVLIAVAMLAVTQTSAAQNPATPQDPAAQAAPQPPDQAAPQPSPQPSDQPAAQPAPPAAEAPPPPVAKLMEEAAQPIDASEFVKKKKLPSDKKWEPAQLDACNGGNAAACVSLGKVFGTSKNGVSLHKSCADLKGEDVCELLRHYAEVMWAKACAAQECGALILFLQTKNDVLSQRWIYQKTNNVVALAQSYETQQPRDLDAAAAIYSPTCLEGAAEPEAVEAACKALIRLGRADDTIRQQWAKACQIVTDTQEQARQDRIAQVQQELPDLLARATAAETAARTAQASVGTGGGSGGWGLFSLVASGAAAATAQQAAAGARQNYNNARGELENLQRESRKYAADKAAGRCVPSVISAAATSAQPPAKSVPATRSVRRKQ
ncbi:MAG: hypothetical protein ABSD88_08575 [Candidatus Korobacteraceae bacterium]